MERSSKGQNACPYVVLKKLNKEPKRRTISRFRQKTDQVRAASHSRGEKMLVWRLEKGGKERTKTRERIRYNRKGERKERGGFEG